MDACINWRFQRNDLLPIINAIGSSEVKEAEFLMIHKAIDLIEKANQFEGIPYLADSYKQNTSAITVSFSLIFPNKEKMNSFFELIREIL